MKVTKELKRIAKRADYYFIHVDAHKATLELMASKDTRGDFNPVHLATFTDIDCTMYDYSPNAQYSGYNGKARIFISGWDAKTLLSLIQVLHIDTEIAFHVAAGNNNDIMNKAGLVFDDVSLIARKNGKEIGTFLIFAHPGLDNSARPIHFTL